MSLKMDKFSKKINQFVHLRNYTQYSLSDGALRISDLINFCKTNNSPAISISDKCNLFGCMEFSLSCVKNGIQPIISCSINVMTEDFADGEILLIVYNEKGYKNLSKILTDSYLNSQNNFQPSVNFDLLNENNSGLICLSGGEEGLLRKNFETYGLDKSEHIIKKLLSIYKKNFFLEIQRLRKLEINPYINFLLETSLNKSIPLVATNENYFFDSDFYESLDVLSCISKQTYFDYDQRKKLSEEFFLKSTVEINELFSDIPVAITNTLKIAKKCHFLLKEKLPSLPKIKSKINEVDLLIEKAREGLNQKLQQKKLSDEIKNEYIKRLDFELKVITEMGYSGYFLIVADFIQWAKKNNIPVGPGRGSGAGSLVAWTLTITDLDPIKFGLLFERFLNPERISMPDFDIDFCMERRDEVIRYVQNKYGEDKVAQIITFGSFQARAALRDVGRVLQIPYEQVDQICKLIPFNPAKPTNLKEVVESEKKIKNLIEQDLNLKKLFEISERIEGLLRHASTHAAGVVISEKSLNDILPLYRDPRSNFPVTQFSMKYVEKVGLVKFDFLGLKTLTVLKRTCKLLAQKKIYIDLQNIPLDDKKTYDLIKSGQTVGVFQFDGTGMRDTIIKIKPDRFEDLIAIVSLYRPGPMDNIPLYVKRKNSKEQIKYIHPDLCDILDETYGIMVYQEQVMQIAKQLAGFSLAKAD
ncbi:MAG: DNA polymerase III subunit alpha, partial [Rickettsiales bacterium]|nr:DNA polymerase III subunit alpha [Rickettsiales bacterium]